MTIPKALFFVSRYYVFVHMVVYEVFSTRAVSPELCHTKSLVISFSTIFVSLSPKVILYVRVYAFTGRNRKMLFFLIVNALLTTVVGSFVLTFTWASMIRYIYVPIRRMGCVVSKSDGSKYLAASYSIFFANVLITMSIMVYTAIHERYRLGKGIFAVIYQDGIVHFILVSTLALGNVFIIAFAPRRSMFLFIQPMAYTHNILTNRMYLHLCECAQKVDIDLSGAWPKEWELDTMNDPPDRPLSPMRFRANSNPRVRGQQTIELSNVVPYANPFVNKRL
ncbi:hypothetical protein DFP72DRAFT_1058380 [Ephemerocybe angulata]|uniref:Uncharacterized protein n=1 Tax=Ephemerocybe angulata TaxID=980116 RepID=A0A8H6IHP6_9AGAR|nr:hypothetical protein DFP72DRAFT_1058380 [Tulosesus angulatus]